MAVHFHKPLLCAKDCNREEEFKIKLVLIQNTGPVDVPLNPDVYLQLLN